MSAPQSELPQVRQRNEPLYKCLIAAMRQRIESGELAPGTKAPSESDLIAEFRVSSTTARRCLDELERIHLVRRVQGKGTFVTAKSPLTEHRQVGLLYNELFSLAEGILSHLFRGVGTALEAAEHQPMLLAAGAIRRSGRPAEALRDLVRQHRLEALLVMSPLPLDWFAGILEDSLPVGAINFAYDDARIYASILDARTSMHRLGERLQQAGHQHVVAVRRTFPPDLLQGVMLNPFDLSQLTGLQCVEESFPYFGPDQTQELVDRALNRTPRPTAFIASGYEIALRVRHAIKARGLSVPDDVSLMFFGAPPGPSEIDGEIVPIEQMSVWAAESLLAAIDGASPPQRIKTFQSQSQNGVTVAPAPSRSS